jgi:hypothetical protein
LIKDKNKKFISWGILVLLAIICGSSYILIKRALARGLSATRNHRIEDDCSYADLVAIRLKICGTDQ